MAQASTDDSGAAAHGPAGGGLRAASFLGLLTTQWLTAVNDNAFRWLAIGIGKQSLVRTGADDQVGIILAAGTVSFVLPYLVLAAPAGYLADRYSKRAVIVTCKLAELAIMALGIAAVLIDSVWLLFTVVALAGIQSALFSPSKLGSIPEMLKPEKIPAANGLMGLTTVMATVVGMAEGNLLADAVRENFGRGVLLSAAALLSVAGVGWLASLLIARLPAANPARTFPWDAVRQTWRDVRRLGRSRALLRVALGVMFFWSVGALAQLNIDQFAFEGGAREQADIVPLLLALVAGVGIGSVLAGLWSGGHVELGILPLGAGGVAINALLLFTVPDPLITPGAAWTGNYVWAGVLLFLLGVSAGFFDVPLSSYLQHRSPPEARGSILAASNFLTFGGILLTSLLYAGLRAPLRHGEPLVTSRQVFLLAGLLTMPVFVYIVWQIPQASVRFVVWLASRTVYRIRVSGHDYLPPRGGALLVANHVSWLDGALMLLTTSRPVRLIVLTEHLQRRWLSRLADLFGVIRIGTRPKEIVTALAAASRALQNGELVCIFPEGGMTRTGQLQGFRRGMLKILAGVAVPVIPVYLDELWGSIFSYQGGKVFWKWPKHWPYPISIHFGPPVADLTEVHAVRRAVQDLGAAAVMMRAARRKSLAQAVIRTCKKRKRGVKIADSMDIELSGGGLLMRALILRRLLLRHVLAEDEQFVGVLLPPSVGGVLANVALTLDRRVPINLNYTNTAELINACIRQAGIRHVLTSRSFLDKMNLHVDSELVVLEDFRNQPTWGDKLSAALAAYVCPAPWLERRLGIHHVTSDDLATVIFTSGSTGQPKGVMLTQANIMSNVEAIEQVVQLTRDDVLVGILPFFHSFGYTVTLWTVLAIDVQGAYHYSPLDARQIGRLTKKHQGTVLLATPTFLRTYLRRCEPEDFASLDVVVAGAEKLPRDLCDAFEEKFHIRPVEGYGTTELSPLVSVNIPPSRSWGSGQLDVKEGTVGRPVPGVSAKVTDLDTGRELGANQPGMLWVKGPNVMKGYLHRPDLTDEVIREGWYKTGDIALVDEDGFIQITGRQSRFSKIGGEMVPHLQVEEALARMITAGDEGMKVAVTAVSDERKGERLVVIHTKLDKTPGELRKRLAEDGLPNLFIPAEDSFVEVDQIPILGTGKLDLRAIKDIANKAFPDGG